MAIAVLTLLFGTISSILYFFRKRKTRKRIYGVVLKKADKNIIYIGYLKEQYPVYVSNRRYDALEVGKKVAIKHVPNSDGTISIVLD